jgi:1-acyl-sn-glycerol-3-phosphate acyltransferase
MIRYVIIILFVALFLVCSIPLMLMEWIIGKFNQDLKNRSSMAIVLWAFRTILWLAGTRVIVKGEENIPEDTAVLYVGNHRSLFDIPITYVRVPRPTGYIAKLELKKVPLLHFWMNNMHCLFLDRKNIKEGLKTILTGIEKAKSGISICIFPEGTRNKQGDGVLPFHEGSFKIAEKSGVPVVPMTLVNTEAIFENHFPKVKPATVILEYGEPIYLNKLEKEQKKFVGVYVHDLIEKRYEENLKMIE